MAFRRDSLSSLLDKNYAAYSTRLKPVAQTTRHSLVKVLSAVDSGIEHQLLGDLLFLADQIFPDTATGEYLRAHWSDRVTPLYASSAYGTLRQQGTTGAVVPAGALYESSAGKKYYTTEPSAVRGDGYAYPVVTASEPGTDSNLEEGQELKMVSSLVSGIDSVAKVWTGGIGGGADAEDDAMYLTRVLASLRKKTRDGGIGDFALWAVDSSPEVTKAFEIKNFGIFGALLIQVIGGNHFDGIRRVSGLATVDKYIGQLAPKIIYTVRTPELVPINPAVHLADDTSAARESVVHNLQGYLEKEARPGSVFSQEQLRSAIVDGSAVRDAQVILDGGRFSCTVLQYPVIGEVSWR